MIDNDRSVEDIEGSANRYRMGDARRNFETTGTIFNADDRDKPDSSAALDDARRELKHLYEILRTASNGPDKQVAAARIAVARVRVLALMTQAI